MANNSSVFSNIQNQASSIYESVSDSVSRAFGSVQGALSQPSTIDAKTVALGAAFFASLCTFPKFTLFSTALGAFSGQTQTMSNLANRGIEVFNQQTSPIKLAIVVIAIGVTISMRKLIVPIAILAVGFYTGSVLGRSRSN